MKKLLGSYLNKKAFLISITLVVYYLGFSQEFKLEYYRKLYSIAIENDTVWVGGKEALFQVNINGNLIKKYSKIDGLPDGPYYNITIIDGEKWISTDKGICILKNGSFSFVDSVNNVDLDSVTVITSDSQGNKWIGTKELGLWKYNNTGWVNYSKSNSDISSNRINAIYVQNDTVWIGGNNGVSGFYNDQWNSLSSVYENTHIYGITEDSGFLVIAEGTKVYHHNLTTNTRTGSLYSYNTLALKKTNNGQIWWLGQGNSLILTPSHTDFFGMQANNVETDKNRNLWFITDQLLMYQFENVSSFRLIYSVGLADNQLCANSIECITKDNLGRIWIGSYYNGISVFDGINWKTYNKEAGLADNKINCIELLPNGEAWVGTPLGISMIKNDTIITPSNLKDKAILSIESDKKNKIWIGTALYGIVEYNGSTWEYISSFGYVNSLYYNSNDTLWAATNEGLFSYNGYTWKKHAINTELIKAVKVCADTAGNIWCIGENWLYNISKDTIAEYIRVPNEIIRDAEFDENNILWILSNSLNRYNGKDWDRFSLIDNQFNTFPENFNGQKLYGTGKGIYSSSMKCGYIPNIDNIISYRWSSSGELDHKIVCQNISNNLYAVSLNDGQVSGTLPPFSYTWYTPDGRKGTSYNYSNYYWQPQNSNSGEIKVRVANMCGDTQQFSRHIIVTSLPKAIDSIEGRHIVCTNEKNILYKARADSTIKNFSWGLFPWCTGDSRSDSILISFGEKANAGNIYVNGVNECGHGPSISLAVSVVKNIPVIDSIIGNTIICSKKGNVFYSVATRDSVSICKWELPFGITGNTSGKDIALNFGSSFKSGIIKAIISNGCGSNEKTIELKNSETKTPSIIKKWGNVLICEDSARLYKKFDWFLNNNILSTLSNNQYFLAKSAGQYKVIATNVDGCSDSASIVINELSSSQAKIFPNPVQNSFILQIPGSEYGSTVASLIDIKGNTVRQYKFHLRENETNIQLKVDNIPEGVYFLKIIINNSSTQSLRLLKKNN